MHARKNSMTSVMISFKLMRTGWIPATPLRKAGKGEETPGVIPFKHGQRIIIVHRCQLRWFFSQNQVTTTCDYFHGSCKIKK